MLGHSVLNRSKNSESIIRRISDSIIDFKSIFEPDLSNKITSNVAVLNEMKIIITYIIQIDKNAT